MAEESKEFVHPSRPRAVKEFQVITDFVNIHNAGGWSNVNFVQIITLLSQAVIHLGNQHLNDAENLHRQIDDLKLELQSFLSSMQGEPQAEIKIPGSGE